MTDKQFDVLMNSIIQIVKDSETKDEAVEKLRLSVNSWGNPKNEIEIFNKWQKIKLSLVFAIDRQTYVKYDCENA